MTPFTEHGRTRAQQRSVPKLAVDWLIDYGRSFRRGGADVYFFDKRSRRSLERDVGRGAVRRMASYLNNYAVVADDGTLITVAPRQRRLKI